VYKPFIIQGTYVTRIISVIDTTRVEVDDSSGFSIGYCYTPWSNRWVLKTGDKVSRISDGDILVGLGGDLFQIVCHHNHGVKTSILGLWPLGSSPEPTSCDTLIFTPTSKFHLLPNSSPDVDITNLLMNNVLDNLSNILLDDSVREDIWAKPSHFTRDLYIDTSAGFYNSKLVPERFNISVLDNTVNYIELDKVSREIVNNTSGWSEQNLRIAIVTTRNGLIESIKQVWEKGAATTEAPTTIEVWNLNQETIEQPDGSDMIFTVPGNKNYIPGKIRVFINGVAEYYFEEVSTTQFRILGDPPLRYGDVVRCSFVSTIMVPGGTLFENWKVNQSPIQVPDGNIIAFDLPAGDRFKLDKIIVELNGVCYDGTFDQVNGNRVVLIDPPPPMNGDKIKLHYILMD
jgi:hypothetical protein